MGGAGEQHDVLDRRPAQLGHLFSVGAGGPFDAPQAAHLARGFAAQGDPVRRFLSGADFVQSDQHRKGIWNSLEQTRLADLRTALGP